MYAKVTSLGVTGLAGYIVQVEADLSGGLPQFNLVGLPDSAVKESSERVRSAIKNLHYEWPASRITINLAPADVRKTGPVYDLPVFVGIMAAQGKLPAPGSERAFLGELGLDGTLRPVTGVLPMALAAVQDGVKELFLPAENAAEAAVAEGLTVYTTYRIVKALYGEEYAREHYLDQWQQAVDNYYLNFYVRNPDYLEALPEEERLEISNSLRYVRQYCEMPLKILKAEQLVGGEEAMDRILRGLFNRELDPMYPYLTYQEFLDACGLTEEDLNLG